MNTHLLKRVIIGSMVVAALAGCEPVFEDVVDLAEEPVADSNETLVIGALLPLSGEAAAYGTPAQHVLNIALADINEAGGVDGKQVELVFEDGGCEAEKANTAVNNLINLKKVKVIIGGFCSSETLAAAPVAEQSKVVIFSPASSSPKVTEAGDYVFRNYPSDNAQGGALADYADKQGYKKVGILTEEQPYTEGIADAFTSAFSGEVVNEKFALDSADFKTQIDKLKLAEVDIFFVNPQTPTKSAIIVKQLKDQGVKGPFFLNDVTLGAKEEVLIPFKEYIEGSAGAEVPYNANHPAFEGLNSDYLALTGEEIPYLAYMSPTYDSLFIIKEAIESVGHDAEKIKDYLYTVQGRAGVAGTLSFDENGDPDKSYRHALKMVKEGEVVDP